MEKTSEEREKEKVNEKKRGRGK